MSWKWLLFFACLFAVSGCLDNSSTGPDNPSSQNFKARAGTDTVLTVNDTVHLHGAATEGETVMELAWQLEPGGAFVPVQNGDTAFLAPSEPNTYQYILRATNGSGFVHFDTVAVTVQAGASEPPVDTTDVILSGLFGKVKSVKKEVTVIVSPGESLNLDIKRLLGEMQFDDKGRITLGLTYTDEGALETRAVYNYDAVGNLAERNLFDAAGNVLEGYQYSYNANGDIVASFKYGEDSLRTTLVYDANGELAGLSYFNGAGVMLERRVFTRNSDANIDKIEFYDDADTLVGTIQHVYDARQNLLQEIYINPDKSLFKTHVYEYDARDKRTSYSVVQDSAVIEKELFAYNEAGDVTEYSSYKGDTLLGKEKMSYDSDGNVIKYQLYQGGDALTAEENFAYDKRGNLTNYSYMETATSLQRFESYEYEFDAAGNWIKKTLKRPDVTGENRIVGIEFQTFNYY